MSAKPDSLDLDALHAALAMRQPALVLLRYRSALVLDEHLRALRLLLAPRALHELRFRGVTDRPHAEVTKLMDEARRLANATIPVVCLRPDPGADADSPVLAEFWKLMNGQREAMGALPAILLLCLDDAHTPAAYHHARDLMSWFAPKFACTSMTPITSEPRSSRLEIERSPSGTGGRSAWDSLYPLWRHVLATGQPITTDHTTRILLPLLGAAVDNGMVSEGHALIAQADALQIPFRDERQRSLWLERCGILAMAQGDLRAALRRFQENLAIDKRLVASAPSNAGWQRDLSVSLDRVGDVLLARCDFVGDAGVAPSSRCPPSSASPPWIRRTRRGNNTCRRSAPTWAICAIGWPPTPSPRLRVATARRSPRPSCREHLGRVPLRGHLFQGLLLRCRQVLLRLRARLPSLPPRARQGTGDPLRRDAPPADGTSSTTHQAEDQRDPELQAVAAGAAAGHLGHGRRDASSRLAVPFPNSVDSADLKCRRNQGRPGRLLHPSTSFFLSSSSFRRCTHEPRPLKRSGMSGFPARVRPGASWTPSFHPVVKSAVLPVTRGGIDSRKGSPGPPHEELQFRLDLLDAYVRRWLSVAAADSAAAPAPSRQEP